MAGFLFFGTVGPTPQNLSADPSVARRRNLGGALPRDDIVAVRRAFGHSVRYEMPQGHSNYGRAPWVTRETHLRGKFPFSVLPFGQSLLRVLWPQSVLPRESIASWVSPFQISLCHEILSESFGREVMQGEKGFDPALSRGQ